jgi:ammonium transporter, Amt family
MIDADSKPEVMIQFLLAVAFASSAVTIVSGALAERCKLAAYFLFAALMSGFVYPLLTHWCASAATTHCLPPL